MHGGALARRRRAAPTSPASRAKSLLQLAEKEAIARGGRALVEPGSAIGISAGTTTYALAQRICATSRT